MGVCWIPADSTKHPPPAPLLTDGESDRRWCPLHVIAGTAELPGGVNVNVMADGWLGMVRDPETNTKSVAGRSRDGWMQGQGRWTTTWEFAR